MNLVLLRRCSINSESGYTRTYLGRYVFMSVIYTFGLDIILYLFKISFFSIVFASFVFAYFNLLTFDKFNSLQLSTLCPDAL